MKNRTRRKNRPRKKSLYEGERLSVSLDLEEGRVRARRGGDLPSSEGKEDKRSEKISFELILKRLRVLKKLTGRRVVLLSGNNSDLSSGSLVVAALCSTRFVKRSRDDQLAVFPAKSQCM